ncbi:MAG: 2-dehydropantoate 2-reductase [Acidimicrobiales bacterium]
MRAVIYGAGAIGGVIGARLFQSDHDVVFIARGDNYDALFQNGIRLETPDETATLHVPVVEDPAALSYSSSDVVLLAMKGQDTLDALRRLVTVVPASTAIVCAQNGVENERVALRMFENVYGMCVMCPATHLVPGVVQASSSPITGLLDVGRWPSGVDERAEELAAELRDATFDSVARGDIARWKWGKLLMNLGSAVQAVCGATAREGVLTRRALEEGVEVLRVAGIEHVSREEDVERRGKLITVRPVAGHERSGGSSWQSLERGTGAIETDYLTGEIVLQGRLAGVATPVNELLQRLANQLAFERRAPGAWSEDEVLSMLNN